jgi:hypothetical protein
MFANLSVVYCPGSPVAAFTAASGADFFYTRCEYTKKKQLRHFP